MKENYDYIIDMKNSYNLTSYTAKVHPLKWPFGQQVQVKVPGNMSIALFGLGGQETKNCIRGRLYN